MDGVRQDVVLGPPNSTTSAAVIALKKKTDPLRAPTILKRKGMGHTAVSKISLTEGSTIR